ncbi:MAG: translation initiation factor IF-2 [Clostridia bacterium]|nr:translation initiation factor IF-2 [Clostridia bacterium]
MNENGNKAENKVDMLEALSSYKTTKLTALLTVVSEQKSKANSLLDNLKNKKELLRAQKDGEQKKVETETIEISEPVAEVEQTVAVEKEVEKIVETPVAVEIQAEKKTVEVEAKQIVEEPAIIVEQKVSEEPLAKAVEPLAEKQEVKPLPKQKFKSDGNQAEKPFVKSEAKTTLKQESKPVAKQDAKPTSKQENAATSKHPEGKIIHHDVDNHTAEVTGPNGEVRRIYIPPEKTKPEKKPASMGSGVQTRVFANGYQRDRQQNPRPNNGPNPNGQNQYQPRNNNRPPNAAGAGPSTNGRVNFANIPLQMPNKNGPNKNINKKTTNQNDDKKGSMNKRQLMKRGYIVDSTLEDYEDDGRFRMKKQKKGGGYEMVDVQIDTAIITTPTISIKALSEKIGKTGTEIIRKLFILEIIKTINDIVDFDTAKLVASELGINLEYKPDKTFEDTLNEQSLTDEVEDIENLKPRPPVITIMGHVDHGKTSLLDYIRKTNIAGGEAGGITQHIGAYTVKLKGQSITFLDTPGHEAFTAMRARGAQVTDIAVIVVAADDGIMPQTIEAIDHAKSANVSIIVAVNKMDKNGADPDRVLQQLSQQGVLAEAWGGDVPVVNVSAKTGLGVESLLENILLLAEIKELKANPDRSAYGTIIEARLDKGKGPIATILVAKGTLKVGDSIIAGTSVGRIRSMTDDKGNVLMSAGPSTPVAVTGFEDVPNAGDIIMAVEDDKFAKQLAQERRLKILSGSEVYTYGTTLEDAFSNIKSGRIKELTLIVKADVQGSLEAVKQSLTRLSNEEVKIKIIHGGVGGIKESDVQLANTTSSIIIGFNVRPDNNSKALAAQHNIDIRCYRIIYDAIDDIEKAIKGMLTPVFKENVLGTAEVREIFKITGVGTIAGCHVTDGKIVRTAKVRIVRDGTIVHEGTISSLKHEKDDVKEMAKNYDCGIGIENFNDLKKDDIFEAYTMEQIIK